MPDVPDRAVEPNKAVEAAARAKRPGFWVITPEMETTVEEVFGPIVEAAAPHIIEQHKEEIEAFIEEMAETKPRELRGAEQFIDGLTDAQIKDLLFVAGVRAAAKKDLGYGPEIRAELKRLIPTPEGKKTNDK